MRLFASLSKVEDQDDGTIKVFGVASSGSRDEAGEVITPDAMKAAIPDYMAFGAVREMHQAKAAGTALECSVDADGFTQFGAHVVDPVAIQKVKTGVYKGFSIGGKTLARDPNDRTTITKIRLSEISLVDRPCNNDATLNLWKADIADPEGTDMSERAAPTNDEVKAHAAELAKTAGKPDRPQDFLVKAREELVAKAAEVVVEPEPVVAAPEPAAETAEPVAKLDPAEALSKALEAATPPPSAPAVSPVTEGLATLGKGLAKLGEMYGEDGLKKGFYGVSYLAEAVQSLCSVQSMAASDALYSPTGENKEAPQMLAEAAQAAGQALLQFVKETIADAMAQMKANGAEIDVVVVDGDDAILLASAAVDLVKADVDLMEKAGKRNSAKDAAAIQASHDHMCGLGAKCDKDNVEKAAGADDDLAKVAADRDRFADALEKALPAVEELKKRLDDQAGEIAILKAQPMPPRTAGSSLAVEKSADATGAGNTPAPPSADDIQKALDAMPAAERADLLMRAAMARPIAIRA